ncbi:phospholipase [Microbacterium sp. LWH11-1.2]|uniref:aggregation-promoting factor C-terminal-like domain-containing protein n=1 Tax=Microbacterium sp. LWH11-1.2 TaxID=3135258 RepID=UPI0031396EF5
MLHETRALRRASAAASARATARRPMMILGTAAAALLGITLTAGIVSAPAAGAEMPDATAAVAQLVAGTEPHAKVADDAAVPLVDAKDAVLSAQALTYDVTASGLDVSAAPPVDVSELQDDIDALEDRDAMSPLVVTVLAGEVEAETKALATATVALQGAFTAAQEKKAADDAAAAAAAEAEAAAAALASANTVEGAKATAQQMMSSRYGWGGDQFSCLESLWNKESGWNYQAYNPSGATGIPQALPGSKMASEGSDWETNATTQIAWGLGYISSVYGTPCSAWGHSQATNWY